MQESTAYDKSQHRKTTASDDHHGPLTPEQRVLRAQMGAAALWATVTDRAAQTEAARATFMGRFAERVDPDGSLRQAIADAWEAGADDEAERLEDQLNDRIGHAKREHFKRLAFASSRARSRTAPGAA